MSTQASDTQKIIKQLTEEINSANTKLNQKAEIKQSHTWWSAEEAMTISASVLLFGLVICILITYLITKGKSADNVLKALGTVLIIVAALFLVVAGYDDKQIAPVMGLLGTIAGYLLGKDSAQSKQ